jgi:hypothetical protein
MKGSGYDVAIEPGPISGMSVARSRWEKPDTYRNLSATGPSAGFRSEGVGFAL